LSLTPRKPELANKPERHPVVAGILTGVAVGHLALPAVLAAIKGNSDYGIILFIGVPMGIGFLSTLFLGFRREVPWKAAFSS